jgi:hypothetical protein
MKIILALLVGAVSPAAAAIALATPTTAGTTGSASLEPMTALCELSPGLPVPLPRSPATIRVLCDRRGEVETPTGGRDGHEHTASSSKPTEATASPAPQTGPQTLPSRRPRRRSPTRSHSRSYPDSP